MTDLNERNHGSPVASMGVLQHNPPRKQTIADAVVDRRHPLVGECNDASCRIDHWLLTHFDKDGGRPIRIQDQKYDACDQEPMIKTGRRVRRSSNPLA